MSDLHTFHSQFISVSTVEKWCIFPEDPQSRDQFLKYFCHLTLDPNTAHYNLILSEKNKVVTLSETQQPYSDHPERFDYYEQVLSKESVCGRCYWEVEIRGTGDVHISVSYKDIIRKGKGADRAFGGNKQSWTLRYLSSIRSFYHNNNRLDLRAPVTSRIGVYVDHSAGTLSFYSVSDTMELLHRAYAIFTQPLYVGFRLYWNIYSGIDPAMILCDPKK
ncbi:tripartite motif-containing protein 16-like protein [Clarias gariepinus]|uniref:tripartite motif-containing protein 16-like protein n=1 Tax=Clarias gariepinus TaxID=13013 RepID=UPI00234D283E|nr:tripartite motif-containing protein 16-like protein [Clarias gariepinus]